MVQETQTGALYQPRGVGWGGRREGSSKGRGYMYTCGWFMFDRRQQNSVKQLSLKKKKIFKKSAIPNAGESMEKWISSYTVGRNVNWCFHYGKQYGVSSKKKK